MGGGLGKRGRQHRKGSVGRVEGSEQGDGVRGVCVSDMSNISIY